MHHSASGVKGTVRLTLIMIYFTEVTQDVLVIRAARLAFCVCSSNIDHNHG